MSIETKSNWLDVLEKRLRQIERDMNIVIFKAYREAGLAIIAEGYLEERYGTKEEMMNRICKRLGFKQASFYRMIELGTMTQDQFSDTMIKFKSLYQWACGEPKKLVASKLVKFVVLESRLSSLEAAEEFYRKLGGELQGKEPYYIGKILETFVKEAEKRIKEKAK